MIFPILFGVHGIGHVFSSTVLSTTTSRSSTRAPCSCAETARINGHSLLADPLPEVDQIARITGPLPLKITHPAKLLPIRVFHPPLHHLLVTLVIHLLEQEQPNHQPHRLGRTTLLAVILPESFFKIRPRNSFSQLFQGMSGITLLTKYRASKTTFACSDFASFQASS